jgi:hypothetical protein
MYKQVGNRYIEKRINVRIEVHLTRSFPLERLLMIAIARPPQPKQRRVHPQSQGERTKKEGGKGQGRDRRREASTGEAKGGEDSQLEGELAGEHCACAI